jgi:nucleoside-diphosphate-sugar epimerase
LVTRVHVIGASGRSGVVLCRSLLADGIEVVPVVRDLAKWGGVALMAHPADPRQADLRQADRLKSALRDATHIVSCAHARHTQALLAAAPPDARVVLLGSTRKFTRWPDAHGNGVLAGESALIASGRLGVMLHPTMIYGAEGENNVQRLATLLSRLPLLPLPGGGRNLVQPIHQSDVTRCIRAALELGGVLPSSLVIAGPEPVHYADFVRAVAAAAGLRKPRILPFPITPLILAARLTRHVRTLPTVTPDEIRRLTEDKAFSIGSMHTRLGIVPIPLKEGLAQTFSARVQSSQQLDA